MYNPSATSRAGHVAYEGVSRTDIIKFASGIDSTTISVERPTGLLQRSYCDIQATLRMRDEQTEDIDVQEAYSFNRGVDTVHDRVAHVYRESAMFNFLLLDLATSCTFTPDRAHGGEVYTSNPAQLNRLARYLSADTEYMRSTKCLIDDWLIQNYDDEEALLSDQPTNYIWRIFDDPGQHVMVSTRTQKYNFPYGYVTLDADGFVPFDHVPVTRNLATFASESTRIYIPIKYFSRKLIGPNRADGTAVVDKRDTQTIQHGGTTVMKLIFTLPVLEASVERDGFAYFEAGAPWGDDDDPIRYESEQMTFEGAILEIGGDEGEYARDSNEFDVLMNNLPVADVYAFNTMVENMQARIYLPAIRFAITQQTSFHGFGRRMCFTNPDDEYSLYDHEGQFRESCQHVWRNMSLDNIDFYFRRTPEQHKTEQTYDYDASPIHAARIMRYKYDSRVVPNSCFDWRDIDAQFQGKRSDPIIFYSEALDPIFDNRATPYDLEMAEFEIADQIPYVEGQYLLSIVTFRYEDNQENSLFYISPVHRYETEQVGFYLNQAAADEDAIELLMHDWDDIRELTVSPASATLRTTKDINRIHDYFYEDGAAAHENGEALDLYWTQIDSVDTDDDGDNHTNLRVPVRVILADEMAIAGYLVHSSHQNYMDHEEFQTAYLFEIEYTGVVQSLKLFGPTDHPHATRLNASDVNFDDGDTFSFLRVPHPYGNITDADQEAIIEYPGYRIRAAHQAYSELGDRCTGLVVRASDPLLCGPLSCAPQIQFERPLNNESRMLPKRLGTYIVDYILGSQRIRERESGVLYSASREPGSKLQVACEYMSAPEDNVEECVINCPKFVRFQIQAPELNNVYMHTLNHGKPTAIYIEHDGLTNFQFMYRGKGCPALTNADRFDLFKMFNRVIPRSSPVTFTDWIKSGYPYLIKWEELASWGQIDENMNRFNIEFESMKQTDACSEINIYFVYENHFLYSSDQNTKFTMK